MVLAAAAIYEHSIVKPIPLSETNFSPSTSAQLQVINSARLVEDLFLEGVAMFRLIALHSFHAIASVKCPEGRYC